MSFVTSDASLDGTINVVEIIGYLQTVPETPSGTNWHFSLVVLSASDPCLEEGTFARSPDYLPAITYKFWDVVMPSQYTNAPFTYEAGAGCTGYTVNYILPDPGGLNPGFLSLVDLDGDDVDGVDPDGLTDLDSGGNFVFSVETNAVSDEGTHAIFFVLDLQGYPFNVLIAQTKTFDLTVVAACSVALVTFEAPINDASETVLTAQGRMTYIVGRADFEFDPAGYIVVTDDESPFDVYAFCGGYAYSDVVLTKQSTATAGL